MKFKKRPSFKELENKIDQAKSALANKQVFLGPNPSKLVHEFMALKIGDSSEIWSLLQELLEEITPEHYAGPHPPMLSHEPALSGCELFIFVWDSKKLKSEMYLKFSIKEKAFYYISLHKSNKPTHQRWKMVPNFRQKV